MAENYKLYPLRSLPGIKRDGTSTEGDFYNEGLWTRFYRGLPRSIPGYRAMTGEYPGPSRGLFVNLNGTGFLDIFSGSSDALSVGQFTTDGFGSGVTDITPVGFIPDDANVWQLDSFYNANGGGQISLISHAAPNLVDISSDTERPVYYGDITTAVPPLPAQKEAGGDFTVSGGILALNPYVIAYGSLGLVAWSDINNPALFPTANAANPTPTKIVKGMSIRGGGASPSCLLWSLNSILQMSFVGGDQVWNFQTLTDQSSILSSSGIVEMDGIYYWPGVDRFLTFNGVLRELPNQMNLDFFYSNLNFAQRQKVVGYKIPKWGEIVWMFPKGDSVENNWMVCYNVRENIWFDSPLPTDGRSAAYFAQSWQYPVLSGAKTFAGGYQLWQHEFGTDEIQGTNVNAIPSFIISSDISFVSGSLQGQTSQTRWTQLVGFESDFLFGASMNVDILTREFAQDNDIVAQANVITQGGDNYFDTQIQARYIRYKISSNVQNGYFIVGTPQIFYREGDANP